MKLSDTTGVINASQKCVNCRQTLTTGDKCFYSNGVYKHDQCPQPTPTSPEIEWETKDSGQRESYPSGMVRDTREGKGRYDLVGTVGLRRLAGVYERGASKYNAWNWTKGGAYSRFADSAKRHMDKYLDNELKGLAQDEDHLAQAAWNLFSLMHMEELHPELNDLKGIYLDGTNS